MFEFMSTTCISDAMNGNNNLNSSIKSLKENHQICGRAITVKMPIADNLVVLEAIAIAKPGDILIVDARGDENNAIAGHFVVAMAKTVGIGGIVVDGVIRDSVEIKQLDYPVFCKGSTVSASRKYGAGEINIPISCGGVSVSPGDLVIGDADGVIIVPHEIEEEVMKKAKEKQVKDEKRATSIIGSPESVRKYIHEMILTKVKV